jgi:hypothetical protein
MPQLVSTLTSLAQSPATTGAIDLAQMGSTGYNLYNQYKNQQYQNLLRSYAQDPAKMNAYAAQFTQPLNAGLTTGVANQAQAYLAQRGLSDSPQISEQVESQAIAPYIQQNQQAGYNDALQALNLGGGAINPALQQQNSLSALAKAFSQMGGAGGGSGSNPNQLQLLQNYLNLMQPGTPSVIPDPYAGIGSEPAPIDTSSWGGGTMPDLSSFHQPDSSVAGAGSEAD